MDEEWTGRHWRTGEPVTVGAQGGVITDVVAAPGPVSGWIGPGLIDLQVNGMGGFNLNGESPSPDIVVGTVEMLRREGVSRFCPTIVTAPQQRMLASVAAVRQACERDEQIEHAVLGIHVEGPFISPVDGPRGAHNSNWVRLPDWDEFLRCRTRRAAGSRW